MDRAWDSVVIRTVLYVRNGQFIRKYFCLIYGMQIPTLFFVSDETDSPTLAMQRFDFHEPSYPNWFATMRVIENGDIIEVEWFDSSAIDMESM